MVYGMIVGHQNLSRNAYVSCLCETGHLQRCRGDCPFKTSSSTLIYMKHAAKVAVREKVALPFSVQKALISLKRLHSNQAAKVLPVLLCYRHLLPLMSRGFLCGAVGSSGRLFVFPSHGPVCFDLDLARF